MMTPSTVNLWAQRGQALDGLDVISDQFVAGLWLAVSLLGVLIGPGAVAPPRATPRVAALQRRERRPGGRTGAGDGRQRQRLLRLPADGGDVPRRRPATGNGSRRPSSAPARVDSCTPPTATGSCSRCRSRRPGRRFGATSSIAYLPPQYFRIRRRVPGGVPVPRLARAGRRTGSTPARPSRTVACWPRLGRPAIMVAPPMSRSGPTTPSASTARRRRSRRTVRGRDPDGRLDVSHPGRPRRPDLRRHVGRRLLRAEPGSATPDAVATIIDLSGDTGPTHTGGAASLFGRHNPARRRRRGEQPGPATCRR